VWRQKGEESEGSTQHRSVTKGRNARSRQGAIPRSKSEIERDVMDLFRSSRLLERSRLANEPDERILVGYQVPQQDGHVAGVEAMDRHSLESQPF
jgi:hypothetical protein